MARCKRCNACECQWEFRPCPRCGHPYDDTRTDEQIKQDDKDFDEWIEENS